VSNENSRSIDNSSTQDEVRAYVVDWLESHLPAEWVRAVKDGDAEALKKVRDHVPVDEWFDGLAAARLVAPDWPAEYGGLGLTGDQRRVVSTELSRYKTPRFFNPIGINLVGPALLRWGTEEQKAAHLRPIASHREIWCQLFSEPGAGSDLAGLATMSTRADGGGWRINGSKIWSSFAHLADWGIILTRSDPDRPKHEGITVFLLDMKTPGITIRPLRHITGDHEFNQTFYDDVAVPDSARLGPVNEGWTVAQTMLMNERTAGSGQGAALPGTVSGRSVSGVIAHHTPVSDPELRRRLAQMWIEDQLIQLTNKRIISRRRAGQPTGPEGSIMKLYSSEHTQRMHDLAIDLEGLNGVAWPEDDRWLKNTAWSFLRVRSKTIAGGTSEIQRNILGERVLGLPREPGLPKSTPWKEIPRS
jgi:alkylation response protein AidB-like acyl-CoA dehydrogenase